MDDTLRTASWRAAPHVAARELRLPPDRARPGCPAPSNGPLRPRSAQVPRDQRSGCAGASSRAQSAKHVEWLTSNAARAPTGGPVGAYFRPAGECAQPGPRSWHTRGDRARARLWEEAPGTAASALAAVPGDSQAYGLTTAAPARTMRALAMPPFRRTDKRPLIGRTWSDTHAAFKRARVQRSESFLPGHRRRSLPRLLKELGCDGRRPSLLEILGCDGRDRDEDAPGGRSGAPEGVG